MNDEAPFKLGEKSRRIGWTYAESYDATARRFRAGQPRNMDYWFSSADESAAAEFIEYSRFWAKDVFGRIADYFTEQIEDPKTNRVATAFCIRCPSGKRITAMPSNPRRFRSKGGDVCLDEYAYHDDARGMYKAAQPATMRGGWMRIFSTHNGEESAFNGLVKEAGQVLTAMGCDPHRPPIDIDYAAIRQVAAGLRVRPVKLHRVTLLDAVADGLVENINRYQGTGFTRDGFIANYRGMCLDEDMWNEEYMCVPSTGTSSLLPYELIELCERSLCDGAIGDLDTFAIGDGPLYVGMDIGRRRDLTVLWALEGVGDRLVTRGVKWMEQAPFHAQLDVLRNWLDRPRIRRACIDATGMGEMFAEEAQRLCGKYRVEAVRFTGPVKEELAMPIRRAFEDRNITIPSDRRIREGLHKIRKTTTAAGNLRFEAERDEAGHADEFWALALARHAAGGNDQPWRGEVHTAGRPQWKQRPDHGGWEAVDRRRQLRRNARRGRRAMAGV
ncbi:MAG TPA: hypothetical protein VMY42_26370 [Thermoguttaceae bacterium]|nr:hypothetical protein [Thermoguttaceae bacterium]